MIDRSQKILSFLALPGVGPGMFHKLSLEIEASEWQSVSLSDLAGMASRHLRRAPHTIQEIIDAESIAKKQCENSQKANIRIIDLFSDSYPVNVKVIRNPPPLLHVKGNLDDCINKPSAAVIGTRDPSSFGRGSSFRIAQTLAEAGIVVVSGLALGCDAEAHAGCLSAKGTTIAVLAHGLQVVYPASNRGLADKILDMNGCWISEYAVGTKPRPSFFIDRDRIQSALSRAVIVIETAVKGGTMHTVGFAIEQKRSLYAVSHPENLSNIEKAQGNKKLILEKKARSLRTKEDIDALCEELLGATEEPKVSVSPVQKSFGF